MDIKDYVKKYNLPFDRVKSLFNDDFNSLYESEKEWLENLEDKVHLLKNEKNQSQVTDVINKLKSTEAFNENDSKTLSTFVSKVNTIVRIANRINNFKEGTNLDNGSTLKLYDFFNSVKASNNLTDFNYPLNSNLTNFLPHIYSVIKHSQNPTEYPIYYKYWKNILREVLSKDDDYDSMCTFYRSFPSSNRHLNFATYLGTIGIQIAKNIDSSGIQIAKDSKEYKYLTKDVINIERYNSILDENLDKGSQYFLVGAYWDGSNPADQAPRFIENDIWENGYDDKFIEEVKAVPEGSKIAIKAAFTREKTKSVMAIKAKGIVVKNYNDGKKLDINWEKEFRPFEVDFSGGYWATIKEVTKQDHIEQIFNHTANKDNVFLKTKMKFDNSIFENYIKFLRKINSELGLMPNDERVVYSVRDNRLNFTVGQRYSFNLYLNDSRGIYGVISKKKLLDSSEPYDGNPPQPFYNYYTDFEPSNKDWSSITEAIKDELNRTTKSGFIRHNNSDFENYVFELSKETVVNNDNMKLSLNTILYGPPGTGKTHILKNQYMDMFTTSESSITRQDFLKDIIQNCSWWQVIALAVLELGKTKVADIFNHEYVQVKAQLSNSTTVTPTIWGQLQSHTVENCEHVKVARRMPPMIFNKTEKSEWEILQNEVEEQSPELLELKSKIENFESVPNKRIERFEFLTFHQSYSYEDFIEGIKPELAESDVSYKIEEGVFQKMCNRARNDSSNNYAIFIDEINRGNISSIFGELITLIEDDKREGKPNEIKATLPYSKKHFSVPNNLYIIGTMNTADRSVEALDTALRRRFSFIEMNPESEKLNTDEFKCSEIDLAALLNAINSRIEKLLDKDYCIGHSYFMTIKNRQEPLEEIKNIFQNKILPLLQEYFYGDWGKILLVIGKEFVETKENTIKFLSTDSYEDFEEYDEKPIYNFTKPYSWTIESFKSIYE